MPQHAKGAGSPVPDRSSQRETAMATQVVRTIPAYTAGTLVRSRPGTTTKASSMGTRDAGAASRVAGSRPTDPLRPISIPALWEDADTLRARHWRLKRTVLRLLACPPSMLSLYLEST